MMLVEKNKQMDAGATAKTQRCSGDNGIMVKDQMDSGNGEKQNTRKKGKPMIIMVVVSVLFSLAFIGVYFFDQFCLTRADVSGAEPDPPAIRFHLDQHPPVHKLGSAALWIKTFFDRSAMPAMEGNARCHNHKRGIWGYEGPLYSSNLYNNKLSIIPPHP